MPRSSAASRYQRDRQLRQKPARFIRSIFCTSVRSRRCATSRRKVAASSSVRVLSSIARLHQQAGLIVGCARRGLPDPSASADRVAPRQDRRERRGKPRRPSAAAPAVVGDQVLAQLDRDMRQAARHRVMAHRVAGRLARRIGLVVADHERGIGAQRCQQRHRNARVVVPQDADMPRPRLAAHRRREAVDRQHRRRHAAREPRREPVVDRGVIGREDRRRAARARARGDEAAIAGDRDAVARLGDRGRDRRDRGCSR